LGITCNLGNPSFVWVSFLSFLYDSFVVVNFSESSWFDLRVSCIKGVFCSLNCFFITFRFKVRYSSSL
jgi:hypothetical protein